MAALARQPAEQEPVTRALGRVMALALAALHEDARTIPTMAADRVRRSG